MNGVERLKASQEEKMAAVIVPRDKQMAGL